MTAIPKPEPRVRTRPRPIRRRSTLGQVRAARKAQGPGVEPETWAAIVAWYGGRCAYCGAEAWHGLGGGARITRDHVVPLARGGEDSSGNCVPACLPCNLKKGTSTRWAPMRMHPFKAPTPSQEGRTK